MSQKQACKVYNIPRATLYDKHKGKSDISCPLGSPTILTKAEEEQLATWAINMSKIGYGRTRQELCFIVKKTLDNSDRQTPFVNNLPGRHWVEGFFEKPSSFIHAHWRSPGQRESSSYLVKTG
ncbi:hypothetical protein HOLleu_44571 [Holothuria leucospilota]|uniref:HTH psq-type domain-containing protein n=1 Tax=Holothuria leucospilota TaxID=206669 RepID=A0A9Q0Y8Q9_HOLLE|nr:hypothetical protein HOLleu_44571 [Holothuria leucospilota]